MRRIAMVSLHTSPYAQPGSGDAGGLNVYVVELSRRLADAGIEVDIFTRGTDMSRMPFADGITVVNVADGGSGDLAKDALIGQIPGFARGMIEAGAGRAYDLIHSHYWLSGRASIAAAHRWDVPLVHSMHTTARMKNLSLAVGERAESPVRVRGEELVVAHADRLVANTTLEAHHLTSAYGASPSAVSVVHPGVDLATFRPRPSARAELGLAEDAVVVLFVGRLQPLKAPDVLIRSVAVLLERDPSLRGRLVVPIIGGPSGAEWPLDLEKLAAELGVAEVVRFLPPLAHAALARWYAAADLVAVPSWSETFGLVALEAQAAGTPVVAAAVGGLRTAVRDGVSGLLVDGHDAGAWANALARGLRHGPRLAVGARPHAAVFSWEATAARMIEVYEGVTSAGAVDEEMTA